MRIVMFTDTIGDLNGVSRFIQDMGKLSLENGVDLHIVSSTGKYLPPLENLHNIKPFFRMRMPFYKELDLAFPSRKALEAKLLELDPDIVHISTPGPLGIAAKKLAKKYRLPMMGTYHTDFPAYVWKNSGIMLFKKITDRVMADFYKGFVHVFTRSKEYEQIMADDIKIDRKQCSFLQPGTNLSTFNPAHKDPTVFTELGLRPRAVNLLYVGRISREKNVPFLLEVFSAIKRRHPELDAQLLLAGEGHHIKNTARFAPFDIHFLGPVMGERLSRLYASCDLFLFPSLTDTLGQVVMESQASGMGVIVSDEGGPQSLVSLKGLDGGRIVTGGDKEAWEAAILELINDTPTRKALGEQANKNMRYYDIRYSFERFIDVHRDYYEAELL